MEEFKKISSNEWGAPFEGSSGDPLSSIAQRHATDKTTTAAAILAKDEERQIQGVDTKE